MIEVTRIGELFGKTLNNVTDFSDIAMLLAECFSRIDTSESEIDTTIRAVSMVNGFDANKLLNSVKQQMSIKED